jgi:hypothetical protein
VKEKRLLHPSNASNAAGPFGRFALHWPAWCYKMVLKWFWSDQANQKFAYCQCFSELEPNFSSTEHPNQSFEQLKCIPANHLNSFLTVEQFTYSWTVYIHLFSLKSYTYVIKKSI